MMEFKDFPYANQLAEAMTEEDTIIIQRAADIVGAITESLSEDKLTKDDAIVILNGSLPMFLERLTPDCKAIALKGLRLIFADVPGILEGALADPT